MVEKEEAPVSLKDHAKFRILCEMMTAIRNKSKCPDDYFTIVLDDRATKIISSICKVYDLMNVNIGTMESLKLRRKRFPKSEGIYLFYPCEASLKHLINDFKDKEKPQFGGIHLCLLCPLSEHLFGKLTVEKQILGRIKSLNEINLDFTMYSSNVFHLGYEKNLNIFFPEEHFEEIQRMSESLLTMCTTLYELPHIRYNTLSEVSKKLALCLHEKLYEFTRRNQTFKRHDPRGTLIILDRSQDLFSPLMHDYLYQGLIFDLLEPEDKKDNEIKCMMNGVSTKITLDDEDTEWEKNKSKHIAEVLINVGKDFQEFANSNLQQKIQRKQMDNLEDMSSIIKSMPKYKELMQKFANHMGLAQECMKKYNEKDIRGLSKLEQAIITGLDETAQPIENKRIITAITKLSNDFQNITEDDIIRIFVIYLSAYDLPKKDRDTILKDISVEKRKLFDNLLHLHPMIDPSIKKVTRREAKISYEDLELYRIRDKEMSYQIFTFTPKLCSICLKAYRMTLPLDEYPFVAGDIPQNYDQKKGKPTGINIKKKVARPMVNFMGEGENIADNPRIIIFIVGGLSHQEIAHIGNLTNYKHIKCNVILGSTEIITPGRFLEALETIGTPKKTGLEMEEVKIEFGK